MPKRVDEDLRDRPVTAADVTERGREPLGLAPACEEDFAAANVLGDHAAAALPVSKLLGRFEWARIPVADRKARGVDGLCRGRIGEGERLAERSAVERRPAVG